MIQKLKVILREAGALDVQKCQIIRMNEVEAVQHSFHMAAAPALVSMMLGIAGLIWPSIFPIAISAIQEFMQLVGIKLAFYIALLLGGMATIFYCVKLQWLSIRIAWMTSSLSFVGFNLSATAFGVVIGLSVPGAIEERSFIFLWSSLYLLFIFLALQLLFFCLAHSIEGKYVEPRNQFLGKKANLWTAVVGILFVVISLWAFSNENWTPAEEKNVSLAANPKKPNNWFKSFAALTGTG